MREKVFKIIRTAVTIAAIGGMIFFLIPVIKNYFIMASLFGELVCLTAIFFANGRKWFTGKGKTEKGVKRLNMLFSAGLVLFIVFLSWLGFVTFKMHTVDYSDPPKDTTVIVLGARVYEDGVSLSLKNRLDEAYDYLIENPGAKCVVTGGQGDNEPWPEALAEKEYLTDKGIDPSRIILEDKSTSTIENLKFAAELMTQEGLPMEAVIVTQGFHEFRATSMAKEAGFVSYARKCRTDPILYPTYYSRELMAITKYYLMKII